ncbi:DUF4097 family beta strand repeat-containing protein [Glycomyces buryatensis]|uniref:DUF4097 domain-containing protein n=1 Tax=Glycomyces buryatensis TaxID=2570927 RepID=A0A4S8QAA6_9ACTN|nr:DUF4097 family beta strand repeat-containing protein [Glycomyces buryatensis]THV39772.1 DUF4097 domain-containing protein [Glycomyces buryatensis]
MTTLENSSPSESVPERKSGPRAWMIWGGVLTAVVLLVALVFGAVWAWSSLSPEETDSHSQTYPGPVSGIDLEVEVGNVYLTASEGPDLEVEREMVWKGPELDVSEQYRSDGVFEADADCGNPPLSWFRGDKCRIDYELALPPGASAKARTAVADVNADGLDGEIDLRSDVGSIDAQHLSATATSVETSVGDVHLEYDQVLGDIDVTANVGNVVIVVPNDGTTYAVDYQGDVGDDDVNIATDAREQADYTITVEANVGNLEVRYA